MEAIAKRGDDLLALVLAHQAVVDEHAGQLLADRAVDEQRGHGRIDPARQPADHAPVTDLVADAGDLLVHDRGRRPRPRAAADVLQERRQHTLAVGRMDHLGVELDPVDVALDVLEGRDRRRGRRRQRGEARRRRVDGVAVRHPARLLGRRAGQQPPGLADGEVGAAELADLGALHPAAQRKRQQLHAVADAEHRNAELEQRRVELRRPVGVHRGRPAGEDQPARAAPAHLLDADVMRQQLGEHAALAHAARDELRVLAAEVQDDDLVDRARRLDLGGRLGDDLGRRAPRGDELAHATARVRGSPVLGVRATRRWLPGSLIGHPRSCRRIPGERQRRLPAWRASMRPAPPGVPSRCPEWQQGVAPSERRQ